MPSSVVPSSNSRARLLAGLVTGALVLGSLAGCTSGTDSASPTTASVTAAGTGSAGSTVSNAGLFDSSAVQSISIDVDPDAYQGMIDTYVDSGDKEWISATVTINGTVFDNVGVKLKGNSTLMGLRGQGPGGANPGGPAAAATTAGSSAADTAATTAGSDAADTGSTTATTAQQTPASAQSGGDTDGSAQTSAATPTDSASQSAGAAAPGDRFGMGNSVSADEPEGLPWRIRLDKFVDGQNYQGETDFVVRANNSETSLNEAVALELIEAAGMPSQAAAAAKFSVNGSDQQLRLLVETPDDQWYSDTIGTQGILYKAEAGGDYSYRGDDPASYTDVFEVEADTSTKDEQYAPLIAFLKWLNESDDATFAAELDQWLDIDSFADYLAIQDLVANTDDIDGPGNNSYLSWDESTGLFTVISWDQNLAFGGMGGPGGAAGGGPSADGGNFTPPSGMQIPSGMQLPSGMQMPSGMELPSGVEIPEGMQPPTGDNAGGGPRGGLGGNVLSQKFMANDEFAALVTQATTDLKAELYSSGSAQQILDSWTATLNEQASDLVSTETISSESATIAKYFSS